MSDAPKGEGKKRSKSQAVVESELIDYIENDTETNPVLHGQTKLPQRLKVCRPDPQGPPLVLEISKQDWAKGESAKIIMEDYAAGLLAERFQHCLKGPLMDYNMTMSRYLSTIKKWSSTRIHYDALPKKVGFASDEQLVMHRLPFDHVPLAEFQGANCDDVLAKRAPLFQEILSRMENAYAFCARIGSIFDEDADRKQAVWVWGEADGGKSVLQWLLTEFVGGITGAYGSLDMDALNTPFWKAQLVGKRIGVVQEAGSKFLRSDAFKSITGDDIHAINQKNVRIYNTALPVLLFFFSNEAPNIPQDDALKARIIPCRIKSLGPDKRMPFAELKARLRAEFPYIAAYCLECYRMNPAGARIKHDEGALENIAGAFEAEFTDFIEYHYVVSKKDSITRKEFQDDCKKEDYNNFCQKRIKEILIAQYGVTETRQRTNEDRRVWVLKGIRLRKKDEALLIGMHDE